MVRLIHSLCVIMSAHPRILKAGIDLKSKVWEVPDESKKHRVDKVKWSLAFCFSGLCQSGESSLGV